MKKKNKIVAIIVSVVLGVGLIIGAVPIINRINRVKGTDAAKVLLARENMNNGEKTVDLNNLFSDKTEQASILDNEYMSYYLSPATQATRPVNTLSATGLGTPVYDSPAGKVYKNNGEYIFKNISGASNQGMTVESRLIDIEFRVEQAAKNINYLKNELNIVNKWVEDGFSKFYLAVSSNRETLIEYYEDDTGLKFVWVIERETKENANSVYSLMYTDMQTGQVDNPVYLVYIPNERYEYYYGHEGNGEDYLIAERDKGYWNMFMPTESGYNNVTVDDKYAFASYGSYDETGMDYGTISNSALKEDIISNSSNGIAIKISAFNGISGLHVPEEFCFEEHYEGGSKSYISIDYSSHNKIKVGLENGNYLQEGDEFTYNGIPVSIQGMYLNFYPNPGFADPQYSASFNLDMREGLSLNEKLSVLDAFLQDNGLSCKYSIEEMESNIIKNSEIAKSITDFYTWNGYLMNSTENFRRAEAVMNDRIDKMFGEYQKVKDAEIVDKFFLAKVASDQQFGELGNISVDGAQYNQGKISVNNFSLIARKSDLMENGKQYKLQIGLARMDDNGNFLSENTINLATTSNVESKSYNGEELTLSATGVYDIPTTLEEGRYVVVVYVVTDDECIRVSEMVSVGFVDTVNDTIETSANKIQINSEDKSVIVKYTSKMYFNVSLTGEVTYASLRRRMMAEVLKHGFPMENEEIKTAEGESVLDGNISSGEYKLKFSLPTIDGVVTGYVVCVVE